MQTPFLFLVSALLASSAWALGPKAPFTPPSLPAAPLVQASQGTLTPEAPLALPVLQGLRTGAQPMALMGDQWWPLGSGPARFKLMAVDAHGVWIQTPEVAGAAGRSAAIRLSLLPSAARAPRGSAPGLTPHMASSPTASPAPTRTSTLALQNRSAP